MIQYRVNEACSGFNSVCGIARQGSDSGCLKLPHNYTAVTQQGLNATPHERTKSGTHVWKANINRPHIESNCRWKQQAIFLGCSEKVVSLERQHKMWPSIRFKWKDLNPCSHLPQPTISCPDNVNTTSVISVGFMCALWHWAGWKWSAPTLT